MSCSLSLFKKKKINNNNFVVVGILAGGELGSCAHIVPFTSRPIISHIKMRERPFDSDNDGNESENTGQRCGESLEA